MFLYKIEAAVSVMHVEAAIKKLLDKFFKEYNLPMPRIKIVNQITSPWLGRDSYNPKVDRNNTTLEIQKRVTNDEKSLDRVLAHELIHHVLFLLKFAHPEMGEKAWQETISRRKLGFREQEHGKEFHEWAAKINAVMGKDYVTEKSDESYVTELDKEFYLLIQPLQGRTDYGYTWMVRPSRDQQVVVQQKMQAGAKLFMTKDERFTHGEKIKKYGYTSVPRDKEAQELLKKMYESGAGLTPSWTKLINKLSDFHPATVGA